MRSDRKLRQILLSALKNLRSRRLIDWQLQTVICKDKNGKEEWFVANDSEIEIILDAEYEILHKMGFTKMFQVISSFKTNEFYTAVENLLYKKKRWKNYYKRYKIIFNANNIKESVPDVEAELKRALLNAKIILYLDNEAEASYNSKLKEYSDNLAHEVYVQGNIIEAMHAFKYPNDYVVAQRMLSDELINTHDYSPEFISELLNAETSDKELDI